MIHGEHTLIRTAEPDDAAAFQALYDTDKPRAALLNRTREPVFPTIDEAAELFRKTPEAGGTFYAVEDMDGRVRGFCALRTTQELRDTAFLAEALVLLADDSDYDTPLAAEILEWLERTAFRDRRLNKLICHALDGEDALRTFVTAHGYESNGIQREVLFTGGQWHNIETFTRFNPDPPLLPNGPAAE